MFCSFKIEKNTKNYKIIDIFAIVSLLRTNEQVIMSTPMKWGDILFLSPLPVCLYVCLSVRLSVRPSVWLSVTLSCPLYIF